MQAVLQQIAEERAPRLIVRDADMEPRRSCEGDWYNEAGAVGPGA